MTLPQSTIIRPGEFILALVLCGPLCGGLRAEAPAAKTFHVATDGNDAWSGTLPQPNAAKTDGPMATLGRARDVIRKLKQHGPLPAGGVVVEVAAGLYQWNEPLELTSDDSGTKESPIIYRAAKDTEARLVGGRIVSDWKPVTDPALLARLPEVARGKVYWADLKALGISDFGQVKGGGLQLFFDDRPMPLSRGPNDEVIHIEELLGGDQHKHPRDGTVIDRIGKFKYKGDRPKRWVGEKDLWVHGYWYRDWADDRHKVKLLDAENHIIAVEPPYHRYGYRKGQWFQGLNALAEIDLPGEWCLDRESGTIYFWPPAPIAEARATVSVLGNMITLKGVSHVSIRRLIVECGRGRGIVVSAGNHVEVAGCTIRNLADWAVTISGGSNCGVTSCDISGVGNGGITLSGGDRRTLTPANHYAVNNHIRDFSRINRMCRPAVSLGGVGNRAAHNLIHDGPHQAMSFGGNDHLIELNEIHNVCYEANDGGAIYAGYEWTMRGTVIRHNFMYNITGLKGRGCVGIYLDDMFSGTTISGNVFHQVTMAAFIGGGRDNTVENNIFVDCKRAMHMDARAMGWAKPAMAPDGIIWKRLAAMPYKDPLWSKRYPRLVGIVDDDPPAPKGNLIARNVFYQCKPWDDIYKVARPFAQVENNLVDVDPHFVDVAKMNFQLKDDSPVYQKVPGFQKIPFEQIGLFDDEYRKTPGKPGG